MNTVKNNVRTRLSVISGSSYTEMSDAELVVACQRHDNQAFEVLVKRHQRTVYGLLLKLAPDWTDTADLAQESFIRIWKGIDKLQNPNAFKSWLVQIVTHLFYDELRKRPRRTLHISLDQGTFGEDETDAPTRDICDSSAGPEELMCRKDISEMAQRAIASLPNQFRTAIVLREMEDLSYDDIAKLTHTDIGTVKSRISRARSKVAQILRPQFDGQYKRSA